MSRINLKNETSRRRNRDSVTDGEGTKTGELSFFTVARPDDEEIGRRAAHRTPAMKRALGDEQRQVGRTTSSKKALLSVSHTPPTPNRVPRLLPPSHQINFPLSRS